MTVITANGPIDTTEEATVYVKDLDMFVTVQILEDTLAVVPLGKLCEENGCTCEWKEGRSNTKSFQEWQCCTLHMRQLRAYRLSPFIE